MTCYIPSQIWCEEQLARQHYADALILDSRTKTYFETPWVTGPDNEMRVFPYKTSFGRQSLIDMAAMVRENNIQGFAFDVANGGAKYFGPHVNECPGRAWDDRGVYVDEGVAIAKLMDWCHAHADSSGRTLAVVSNPGDSPCYLTPFRSDSAMIEYDPLSVQRQAAPTLRNFLGHKTMVIWENYELEELLDYEHMSTEQMADAVNGLTDYTIIASLRIAAVPTPRVCRGIRKLARWLPLLTEIALAGWQPVPAATCDCGLPMSRAGFGMRQFLMTGNETPHSASGAIAAENEWFGPGALLFMPEGATSAVNEFNGNATRVPFSLPSRGALVLRSVVSLDSAPDGLKASLHRLEDVDVTQITVELQSPTAWECRLMVPDWGRMRLERVELNGKPVAVRQTEGGWASERRITMSTHSVLAISCRSRALRLSEQELHEFPWVRDGQAGFEIVVAERAEPDVRYAAERLAAYFPYYFSIATDPPLKMAPARILHDQPNPALARVVMRTMPHAASRMDVSPGDGAGTLLITGRTPADVKAAVYELLAALDRRYACGGTLVGTPAIRATGLAGKELADEP